MAARVITPPTADDVRDWARNKGIEVKEKGRLSADLVARYNKGRKNVYVTEQRITVRVVTLASKVADKAGRNRSRAETVKVREVRSWAKRNGFDLGDRGRLPRAAFDAFAMRNAASK